MFHLLLSLIIMGNQNKGFSRSTKSFLDLAALVCCCHRYYALCSTNISPCGGFVVTHSNSLRWIKPENGPTRRSAMSNLFPLNSSLNNHNEDIIQEAKRLREKARKLKQDVYARQTEKEKQMQTNKLHLERTQEETMERQSRYSAMVPILKSDGSTLLETVYFTPRFQSVRVSCENNTDLSLCKCHVELSSSTFICLYMNKFLSIHERRAYPKLFHVRHIYP